MKTNEQLKAENQAIRSMLAEGAAQQLLALPNVLHVSVGLKETGGKVSDQLCVRVYVKEKKRREQLAAGETVPAEVNGVPTDVNVVGSFEFSEDNTRYRPIRGGIQFTNRIIDLNDAGNGTQISRGTLGCVAIDNTDNAPVVLGNWHVMYANSARNGDKVFQPPPTSIPPTNLADVPLRPSDTTDKIAVLRRSVISASVDGAIAAIDVSSCCHCCGIHFSNEIIGLSVAGNPPRSTIVGDERATSGMHVFKVGKSTARTEGVVVDDNYPSFKISRGGTDYTFTGQIAIQNSNPLQPFSAHGDSGSVIINLNNKIVGLLFAAGKELNVKGVKQPFISLANHISDVFTALKIRIAYSQDIKVTSGSTLADVPEEVFEAPIPEPYRELRRRVEANLVTARLFAIGQRHSDAVMYLVNHCRPVMVAWRRNEGPALLATVMGAVRDGHYRLPERINGVAPHQLLLRMRAVLTQHGSRELGDALNSIDLDVEEVFRNCGDVNELIERLARSPQLTSVARGPFV
jgi:hypothetical protein